MASIINATTSTGLVTTADNSGSLQLATNSGTTAMTIDTSQNVGIGTTSPSVKMEIRSAVNSPQLVLTGTASRGLRISTSNPDGQNDATVIYNAQDTEAPGYGQHIWQSGGTERMRLTPAGLFQFNSGFGSVRTAYGCRAWVNFNGSNGAIRGSGGVSSVNRNSTGDYSISFTAAMPDLNYGVSMGGSITFGSGVFYGNGLNDYSGWTTSSCKIRFVAGNGTYFDPEIACISVFR